MDKDYEVGRGTYGTPTVLRYGSDSKLIIGAFCSISKNVTIFLGGNHRIDWISTYPFYMYFGEKYFIENCSTSNGDVIIGNDVWLGFGSTIMSGVKISDGSVIGANSVVTTNVEPYSIVGGNPARLIKKRFDDMTIEKLMKIKWWNWSDKIIGKYLHILSSDNLELFFKMVGIN